MSTTYSVSHYDEYQQTKNKNLFEEVIDQMMLDGIDPSLQEKIKNLPLKDKRLAILAFLDKDRNLFMKIKSFISSEKLSKLDHLKEVILMLRKYVKVGEVEKKKFGEVMTDLSIVKDQISILPSDVWKNPNLKWFDPANGTGPYPLMVIYKLMVGLEEWQPDPNLRYKHIIENMIYVCELQPKNMFLYMCLVDPYDEYDLNIYTGSFLEEGFDKHMEDVWGASDFISIGNPPYNNEVSSSGTSSDIYDEFIIKLEKISKLITMITPSKWFNKPDKKRLRDLMILDGKLSKIVTNNEYFNNLNIRGGVSYFLMDKNNNDKVEFNGVMVDLKSQYQSLGFILMNQNDSNIIENILNKISKYNKMSIIFNSQSYFGLKTNHKKISESGHKCYFSSRQKNSLGLNLDDKSEYFAYVDSIKDTKRLIDRWKVITPAAYGFVTKDINTYNQIGRIFISEPNEVCTESFVFFDMSTKNECENLSSYLRTNFVKFLISIRKNKQHVTSKIFENIPLLDFSQEWTDEKIYKEFDLTQDEIDFINKHIPKYYE